MRFSSEKRKLMAGQALTTAEEEGLELLPAGNSSGFKGVTWLDARRKFEARSTISEGGIYLGVFVTAVEAALAYARYRRDVSDGISSEVASLSSRKRHANGLFGASAAAVGAARGGQGVEDAGLPAGTSVIARYLGSVPKGERRKIAGADRFYPGVVRE